ncbi:mandelate racemase/muconate lactonizing enzyme family protein [Mycobacterium sp. NPDC003449]
MKIASIRPVLLGYDTSGDAPLAWSGGTITTWDAALVEVTLPSGVTGLGEVAQGTMAAEAVPGILDALSRYLEDVDMPAIAIGDHLRDKTRFWARGGISSGVIAAVELACLDAEAIEAGLPLWQHLQAQHAGPAAEPAAAIDAYASGGLGTTFDQVADWTLQQADSGFRTIKIRAMGDPATTIDLARHVAGLLGSRARLCLDAVQGCAADPWPVSDAIAVGQELSRLGMYWYEEPCAVEDLDGYVAVRSAVDIAVTGVESFTVVEDFHRLLDAEAVDIAQPDLSMIGGYAQFRRVVDHARAAGIRAIPHVWGSGVQLMTSIHAAFACGLDLVEVCTLLNPLREATLTHPLALVDGAIRRPTEPGSGATLPADAEQAFAYRPGRGMLIR